MWEALAVGVEKQRGQQQQPRQDLHVAAGSRSPSPCPHPIPIPLLLRLVPCPRLTSNSRRRLFSVSVTLAMAAVVCTWPDTVCPPISSPTRALRSKLTSLPGCRAPRLVRRSVSAMTSKRRVLPSWAVTVRQVPLMATLAPIATSVARAAGSSMSKQQKSVLRSTARTVALPCTMPANQGKVGSQ